MKTSTSLKTIGIVFLCFCFTACSQKKQIYKIRLDQADFKQIVNDYGPPVKNKAFTKHPLIINGKKYKYGLGVHAPSELNIPLHQKGISFSASIGIDQSVKKYYHLDSLKLLKFGADYVYSNKVNHYDYTAGGTAIFKIFGDGKLIFTSDTFTVNSPPVDIYLDIKKINTLKLVVENAGDGNFTDFANWAKAKLTLTDSFAVSIFNYPEKILVNHAGYQPLSYKSCIKQGTGTKKFKIIDAKNKKTVFSGKFAPQGGDMGNYWKGDFSDFKTPGKYYIQSGKITSEIFEINQNIYINCLKKHLDYFTLQRSGHPEKGWAPNNHLDDGIRTDNGKHQDVTGGWYDASDVRKPTKGNARLLFSLVNVLEKNHPQISRSKLIDEIMWGNKFLLSMQEPQGYLMHYIGNTKKYHDNRWTDNIPNSGDDRHILVEPAENITQFLFILSQLKLAKLLKTDYPEYCIKITQSAKKCYEWTTKKQDIKLSNNLGLGVAASIEMYSLFRKEKYLVQADNYLKLLHDNFYQEKNNLPFFKNVHPRADILENKWILYGFSVYLSQSNNEQLKNKTIEITHLLIENNYRLFQARNAFSIMPWLIVNKKNSVNQINNTHYKYFLHVGMNNHLAGMAYGMMKIANQIPDENLKQIAQSHLDWIYGKNPLNKSTVINIGYNQPDIFKTGGTEFKPPTPELNGGVMTGIGGTYNDKIAMYPGWWWTTEYWSPSVMGTVLLVNELIAQ